MGRCLDYSRLVKLIEDSFGRRLDIDHYRNRIRDKTAAVIVAGDYEGAAIVTKESAQKRLPEHGFHTLTNLLFPQNLKEVVGWPILCSMF